MSTRLLIIGLDGADWSLLRPLMDAGAMPSLRSFVARSAHGVLESVLQTNSMAAWTTMMTGVNPGRHGVYDFVRRTPEPFQTALANSSTIRAPTFFEMANQQGLPACVIDMPPLFPTLEIDGVMIGGFAPFGRYADLFWPREIAGTVEAAAGTFLEEVNLYEFADRPDAIVANMQQVVSNRLRATGALLDDREWGVVCTVLTPVDRIQHMFWRDLTEGGPRAELARSFYEALDRELDALLGRIDMTQTNVIVLSDHGFRPLRRIFDVNQILSDGGLCRWTYSGPAGSRALRFLGERVTLPGPLNAMAWQGTRKLRKRIAPGARAFSDLYDGVSINLAGRERSGSVPAGAYDEVREEVAARLLREEDAATGERVLHGIVNREECYHGPFLEEAADLVLEPADGYAYAGGLGFARGLGKIPRSAHYASPVLQGAHGLDGIFAAAGPGVRAGELASPLAMIDVAPTALALMGVAPPGGLDGRVAEHLIAAAPAGRSGAPVAPAERATPVYSEEEEEQVRERLRGLGYIE